MRTLILVSLFATLAVGAGAEDTGAEDTGAASCWPSPPGTDPAKCPPDDPRYPGRWEFLSGIPEEIDRSRMHPSEVELGSIGFSLDRAWQHTVGRDDVIIAVLDSGIRWAYEDLRRKLYLNAGELPLPEGAADYDANGDGVFDIDDYVGDSRVGDRNGNGLLDPEDLILVFSDCEDGDGNGYPDDISGYDFFGESHCGFTAGDNNPRDDADFGHGTGIAATAAAETDNGIEHAGVCPRCRVLPVRVGDTFVVDANQFARGAIFAVNAGASVIASALGSYNNTPAARYAVDYAYDRGVSVVASAADEFSYHHNYPSVYNHTIYVNAIRYNHADDFRRATTFWGVNPCTNFGARVWLTVPATSCSSGATSRLAGAVGLMESMAREAGSGGLGAGEVLQLLRATADDLDNTDPDWGNLRYRAKPGYDQFYGYGRLNVLAAVRAIADGLVPPVVDLDGPRWFEIVSPLRTPRVPVSADIRVAGGGKASYRLEYATGVEPRESDYVVVAGGEVSGSHRGSVGVLDFTQLPVPRGTKPHDRESRDAHSVTLRLRVTDEQGLAGEARRSFFVFDDPAWQPHFPVSLGVSGEASPLLVDLDEDGRDEIVLATADGYLRIVHQEPSGLTETRVPLDPGPPVDPSGATPAWRERGLRGETAVRGAVAGDLLGNGSLALVVASRNGKVYAFTPRGERLPGFPVSVLPAEPASPEERIERGILSRPVLVDLDGRPGLEIVVSALDGRIYVWRGDARLVNGFPVTLERDLDGQRHRAKIVSTPAIGDIDGDGAVDIVVGSNLVREDLSAAWAVRAGGTTDPRGPLLPGWGPFEVSAVRPRLLPTVGSGVTMEPTLSDVDGDGDLEVVLYAVTGSIVLVDQQRGKGPRVTARFSTEPALDSGFKGVSFLAGTGSAIAADTDDDGTVELYAPLISMRIVTFRTKPGIPLDVPLALGAWPLTGSTAGVEVPMLPGWPRRMEDLMLFSRPTAFDVDGDGSREVLMGSGGYLLHAFRPGGGEAPGFPLFTGGWLFSTPALGDLDGDGRQELVAVTREGYLFAWDLSVGSASSPSPDVVTATSGE